LLELTMPVRKEFAIEVGAEAILDRINALK
jgi:hypothetical protein